MYPLVLGLHNLNRWVILLAGLVALVGVVLWLRRKQAPTWATPAARAWMVAFDVQLLLGLALFAFSPALREGYANPMGDPTFRYFLVEHAVPMLLALGLVHWGMRAVKKADEEEPCMCTVWPLFVAYVILLASIPWDRPLWP